ncbi:MAG: hypothetical protein LBB23_04155 [Rickettsiales bacterium]|jgi:tRNA (guanine-N7-)-methyltransferase|nr:hypothetical protein [Rickettsiales bacterium]
MEHLIRTFGRIHGKKLSKHQQNLIDSLLPNLIPRQGWRGGGAADGVVRILEIGFGAGEHIIHLLQNPNFHITGADPFINGVASLLSKLIKNSPPVEESPRSGGGGSNLNIKTQTHPGTAEPCHPSTGGELLDRLAIHPGDVRELLIKNPDIKFDLIYILHPDPWPKAKHEKRRLLQSEFLNVLDEHLNVGGLIIFGTDHTDYFNWAESQILTSAFIMLKHDSFFPPASGLNTRYKVKNKFGSERPLYAVLARRTEDFPSPDRLAKLDLTLA